MCVGVEGGCDMWTPAFGCAGERTWVRHSLMRKSSSARTLPPGGRGISRAATSWAYGMDWTRKAGQGVLTACTRGDTESGGTLACASAASDATVSCRSLRSCGGERAGSAPAAASGVDTRGCETWRALANGRGSSSTVPHRCSPPACQRRRAAGGRGTARVRKPPADSNRGEVRALSGRGGRTHTVEHVCTHLLHVRHV